jgi:hypothetical protein
MFLNLLPLFLVNVWINISPIIETKEISRCKIKNRLSFQTAFVEVVNK